MISYLSLKRKKPARDTKILNEDMIEIQLGVVVLMVLQKINTSAKSSLSYQKGLIITPIIKVAKEPTATKTKTFWITFIQQFNIF